MTRQVNTRDVEKGLFENYVKKAEENALAAGTMLEQRQFNAAAVNAVHASISAIDALCVYNLGKRCSSESHLDAIELIKITQIPDTLKSELIKLYGSVIRIKNMAEYEERLVREKEAQKAVKEAVELLKSVKKVVAK